MVTLTRVAAASTMVDRRPTGPARSRGRPAASGRRPAVERRWPQLLLSGLASRLAASQPDPVVRVVFDDAFVRIPGRLLRSHAADGGGVLVEGGGRGQR